MHGRKRWGRILGSLLGSLAVAASSLAGCAGTFEADTSPDGVDATAPAVPERGGHLVFGVESDPNGFDPTRNAWDNVGIQVANAIYDPLVAVAADGRFQPYLAAGITPNGDYTSWTLRLRPNIRFSNGDELNADALVVWVTKIRESPITGPPAQLITGVQAIEPLAVEVTLSRPWATLPALLSGQGGYVVAPAQLNDPNGHSNPIGTGPFMLSNWQQDRAIRLVRNPRYWRAGLPYLDAVDFVIEPLGTRRVERLLSGDMDVTNVTMPWDLRALDGIMADPDLASRLAVERDTGDSEKAFVMFNTQRPPLNDVRIRQAIGYATNIPALAAMSGWTMDKQAFGPLSQSSPYYFPANYPAYDVDKAKALVREYLVDTGARGRRDITFKMLAPSVGSDYLNVMLDQWKQAGINVQLEMTDVKTAVRLAVFGQYDSMVLRYFASPDPDVLWHFFVSDTIVDDGISLNFTRLRNDEITEGMNAGRATLDPVSRRDAYARVQRAMAEQMPFLWLNKSEWRIVRTKRVHDAHNLTLPDGSAALPLMAGTLRLTETWLGP